MNTETAMKPGGAPSPPSSDAGSPGFDLGGLLRRPETGAFLGLAFVFIFFSIFGGANFVKPSGAASYLNVAANLGIVALPVGLLMIAGELDISIGAMIPAGAMTVAIVSGHYGAPIIVGMAASLAFGAHRRTDQRVPDDPNRRALADRHARHALRGAGPCPRPLGRC